MPVYQYLNDKHVASAIRNVFKLNKSQQPYFSIYMEQEGGQRLCGHNTGGSEAVWTWHKGGQKLLGHGTGGVRGCVDMAQGRVRGCLDMARGGVRGCVRSSVLLNGSALL